MGVVRPAPLLPLSIQLVVGVATLALLWFAVSGTLGAQETNRVPEFPEGDATIRVVDEGTAAGENVGDPVVAVDFGDIVTHSLAGDDAAHFSIDASTGQILTNGALDYDTKGTYLVTVQVTDGADDVGQPDASIDDTIQVTIRVSVPVDLNDWTAEDYDSSTQYCASGSWTVDADGKAKETGGEAPSMLYGNFDAYGKRLTATVNPGSDDDFFGLVVGFKGGDSANADADYLLIDWKKLSQSFDFSGDSTSSGGDAEAGLRLSRVTGIPDCDEFWQHANLSGTSEASGLEELQEADTKGSTQYNERQNYQFAIDFGSESIRVYLDGRLELDIDGEFSDGSFGAYAMLHNSATFWDFSYTDGSFPSTSELVDQPGAVTLSSTTSEVDVPLTATLTDPDGGVTNEVWQWQSSPIQDPPTWTAISGTDGTSYTPTSADAGKRLRATVSYDDVTGTGRTAASPPTTAADRRGTVSLSSTAPVVGEQVVATLTDPDGGITNQTWVWESSPDQETPDWIAVAGSDSSTYTPQAGDAGKLLRGRVSYDDAVGMGRSAESGATAAVDQRGSVMLAPQIPVVGEAVTGTLTDPDGGITNQAWKWERSLGTGIPEWGTISGAQSSSYTPTALDDAGKILRMVVTYTDGTGSGRSATSAATSRVDRRGVVMLSSTVPDVGIAVTATLSDEDGGVTDEVWQWESSPSTGTPIWRDIIGATTAAYTPVTADEGELLRAILGYEDAVGSGRSSTSQETQKVGKPGTVSVDSTEPVVGEQLMASLADADGSVSNQVWQWEISPAQEVPTWSSITGATSVSYTPQATDAGKFLRVRVRYTDGSGGRRMARSSATARVDSLGRVTLSPDLPVVGTPLRATLTDADGSITSQTWKWERSPGVGDLEWTAIGGAQSDSYTPTAANDSGKLLRVVVSYDDAIGTARSATSSASKRVDREGVLTVSPSPPVAGKSVTATLSDADGMVSNQLWMWERSLRTGTAMWTEIADATATSYTPMASADGGKLLRATVSYDDAIGTGRVAVSATTQPVDQPGMVTLTTTMPVAGEALTATLSDGDGGILNAAWQWESSPDQGTPNWSGITGAEAATYTTSASLAGKLLRAVVNYDDTTGRGRQAVSDTTAPLDQRGMVTLSPDAPIVGQAVTATLTDADGGLTNQTWVWESSPDQGDLDWAGIPGSDSSTYTPQAGDAGRLLRLRVSYDDAVGTGRSVSSAPTVAVDQRGVVTLSPVVPVVGEVVTAVLTDPDGGITNQAWKWERSPGTGMPVWTMISGAQTSNYTPTTPDDAGKVLRVVVIYTDGTGSGKSATSAATNRVDQRGVVTLSTGVPDVGIEVTATLADEDGGVTGEVWQWQSSPSTGTPTWINITGASTAAYTPVAADEGELLRAMIGYDDAVGRVRSATSQATQKVGKPGTVSLDSTEPVVGEQLTAMLTDADGSVSSQVWQWESSPFAGDRKWSTIADAISSSYMPQAGDAGKLLRVQVRYTDGSGSGRMARSSATARVDSQGIAVLLPDTPVVGKPVRATLTDTDGGITNRMWKWERSPGVGDIEWTAIGGDQSDSYTPTAVKDSGKLLRVVVSYDDVIGIGRSASSSATERVDREGVVTLDPSPPVAGQALTATLTDADGSVSNQVWKWERSPRMGTPAWTEIADATASSYTPAATEDGGMLLRAAVLYDDAIGTGRVAVSASTLPIDQPGVVTLTTTEPVAGEALTATLADDDGGILNVAWQWESEPISCFKLSHKVSIRLNNIRV